VHWTKELPNEFLQGGQERGAAGQELDPLSISPETNGPASGWAYGDWAVGI
jgi:hypothetical protein